MEKRPAPEISHELDAPALARHALDHAADPVYWVRQDGSFAYVNHAACRAIGYAREDFLRLSVFDIDPDCDEEQWSSLWQSLREQGVFRFPSRHKTATGVFFPVELHGSFLSMAGQEISSVFAQDISRRVQAEERIADLARFPTENPNPVFRVSAAGALLYANDAAENFLTERNEDLMHGLLGAAIRSSVRSGKPGKFELDLGGKHYLVSLCPVLGRGYVNIYVSDITMLRSTEAQLRESREYLEKMWSSMNIGILLVDAESREILRINPALLAMSGYAEEELLGRDCHHLVCSAERHQCPMASQGQAVDKAERKLICADGRELDVEKTVVPILLNRRKVFLETFVDISDWVKSQKKLRELSRIQSSILNTSRLGIAFVQNRVIRWVNPQLCRLFGYTKQELSNASTRIFYASDADYDKIGDTAYRFLFRERFDRSVRFQRRSGDYFFCRLTGEALDGEHPREGGSIWMFEDISEKIETEAEHRRLATAIDQSPETIVITDSQGAIQYANPAFERITGYSRAEVIGKNPRILKSGEHPPDFYKTMWETITAGRIWAGTVVNKRKDGSKYAEEASIAPVKDEHGCIVNYVAVKRDITQELVREDELRRVHKLEAVGQLAAGIAHEINTPIQYVSDNLSFLNDGIRDLMALADACRNWVEQAGEVPGSDSSELNELKNVLAATDLAYLKDELPLAVSQSLEGAGRVAVIVRAMKDFSHPGTTEMLEEDLNHAIRTTVEISRNEWKYTATVELDLCETLPLVPCFIGEINQVVLNMIVNARDAIQEKTGWESVEEKGCITIRTSLDGPWALIQISDSGAGVKAALLERIFDPFFTTKEIGKGTGQGLSISHDVIVKKHHGRIHVTSRVGEGTVFEIRLPLARVPG